MKIVVIDNYDSFVYNLVHYLEEFDCQVTVFRNDEFSMEEIESYDKILLSPGPGIPDEAGFLKEVIKTYAGKKPIFGVCLGQQAIGEVFGGKIANLKKVFHGVATKATILVESEPLFKGLDNEIEIGRYHSWVVSKENFPESLEITSVDETGQIMSLRHREFDICGVQFHPESVLTPNGKQLIKNWIEN
ncbi:MAG TPA: aminodeoxychorismate/anthranilate synthase component II [Flavobacteriaceae bacterium]|nr:aminodeoxychorismate/anthranilate synthase component II [Flavobacteriaceae bacterium]HAT66859.1 aminodeoxychorismate/anthranilate synthase component II [Flavobacteriaceae bacterium]|tara:strand:+ start:878 stop:1444 length:567 start_codon:yes stop_codon:yes gene_type:complete